MQVTGRATVQRPAHVCAHHGDPVTTTPLALLPQYPRNANPMLPSRLRVSLALPAHARGCRKLQLAGHRHPTFPQGPVNPPQPSRTSWSFPRVRSRMYPTFFPFGPVAIKLRSLPCGKNTEHPCGGVPLGHTFRHTVPLRHTCRAGRCVFRSCWIARRTSPQDLWRVRQNKLPQSSIFLPFTGTQSPRLARLLP
jgi:hypothetical protein